VNIKNTVVKLLKEYVIQEKIKDDFEVLPTTKQEAEPFVMKHYLEKFPTGIKRIYGVYRKSNAGRQMVGVIIYGVPFMTAAKFLEPEVTLRETLELKRLFIDDLGIKNLESFVIGQSLKMLKKDEPSIKVVITFADDTQGHKGIIYQATNAIYLGSGNGKHKYIYIIGGDINAIKNKVQRLIQQYPKGIAENLYYSDIGHTHDRGDKIWFWTHNGNLIVKPASKYGGHLTYRHHDRSDFEGRYDAKNKMVSIVDMGHFRKTDGSDFGYDSSEDLRNLPTDLVQMLRDEFGDDIKMKIFMEESV